MLNIERYAYVHITSLKENGIAQGQRFANMFSLESLVHNSSCANEIHQKRNDFYVLRLHDQIEKTGRKKWGGGENWQGNGGDKKNGDCFLESGHSPYIHDMPQDARSLNVANGVGRQKSWNRTSKLKYAEYTERINNMYMSRFAAKLERNRTELQKLALIAR